MDCELPFTRDRLRDCARLIELGEPLPVDMREFVGWIVWRVALRRPLLPGLLPPPAKAGAKGSEQELYETGTSQDIRLASIVRLFHLAGVGKVAAVSAIAAHCDNGKSKGKNISKRTIYNACKEWGFEWRVEKEDMEQEGFIEQLRQRMHDQAKGPELEALRESRDTHCKKLSAFLLQ